jgi:CDP-diacylglycerol---glycerol-3-phosphate 3-phosphatidyltransferase
MKPREQRQYNADREETVTRMTPVVQRTADRAVQFLFLWAFPYWIKPNHLTFLRFAFIPAILALISTGHRWWALGMFVAGVSTDFIDGAMARTRDQITVLGTYIDPVADKLLVGFVLGWVGYRYVIVDIILGFIALELTLSAIGARILLRTRSARPSNAFGKSKMIVQSVALFLFLFAWALDYDPLRTVALYMLWLALVLAVFSGTLQMQGVIKQRRPAEQPPGTPGAPGAAG